MEGPGLPYKIKIMMLLVVSGLMTFLTLNFHSRAGIFHHQSEIFSDKAGYYIYLPATFLYQFDMDQFPDSVEFKTGNGFIFDREHKKILTKHPYGVALFQLPFFAGAHLFSLITGQPATGFTRVYHYAIDLAAVFYLVLGLFFLFRFMQFYFDERTTFLSLFFFLFGTNLLFYSFRETGLSHIYSFFLIAGFLYCWKKYLAGGSETRWLIYTGLFLGAVIAVRPVNAVFMPILLMLDAGSFRSRIIRLAALRGKIALILLCIAVFILPQLVYNMYAYGKAVAYPFGDGSFIYKYSPQVHRVLITFENGLFIYNPVHFFTIAGMLWMVKDKKINGLLAALLFISITMLYASWESRTPECGFGNSGFVGFYPFLVIPFAYVLQKILKLEKLVRVGLLAILVLLMGYNIRLSYVYDGCWHGKTPWDFDELKQLIF